MFETKRIEVPSGATLGGIAHERMAEMSADGWQLVAVVGSAATHYLYYQREEAVPEPPTVAEITRIMARQKKGRVDV